MEEDAPIARLSIGVRARERVRSALAAVNRRRLLRCVAARGKQFSSFPSAQGDMRRPTKHGALMSTDRTFASSIGGVQSWAPVFPVCESAREWGTYFRTLVWYGTNLWLADPDRVPPVPCGTTFWYLKMVPTYLPTSTSLAPSSMGRSAARLNLRRHGLLAPPSPAAAHRRQTLPRAAL